MRGSWIVTAIVGVVWFTGSGCDDAQEAASTASASGNGGATAANTATTTNGSGGSSSQSGSGGAGGSVPSSGCDKPSPTGVQMGSITVGSDMRTYVLSVPDQYDPSTPLPLVFAWHGLGGSGSLARLYFGVEMQAGGAAIFVYPDGLVVQPQNQPGWELASDGRDVAFFDALLALLSSDYCIDQARVFSTGHSFGGFMTNSLGCARSSVLRAIAPVAGGGPFDQSCDSGSLSAWLAHGTNDNTVPFTAARLRATTGSRMPHAR